MSQDNDNIEDFILNPLVRERQLTNHSSNKSHSSINHIINYDDDDDKNKLIGLSRSNQKSQDIDKLTSSLITANFKENIKNNIIIPSETDNKNFQIKIYKYSKNSDIKKIIFDYINSSDPKITSFINNTIDLIMTRQIKEVNRDITSIHNKTYYKINISSDNHYPFLRRKYIRVYVSILSISFV